MKIIFQNKDFIVIDKLVGLAVHSGVNTDEPTLVDFLLAEFPEIKTVGDDPKVRPGIVHRLDKETSGVMIVARNQKSFEYLKSLFKNRQIEKKYLALVHGKLKTKAGKIEGEMGRSKRDFRKQALACPVKSREAGPAMPAFNRVNTRKTRYSLTHYKVLKEFNDRSLLEVRPATGRMHQIRVHLHSIGHPVVGDEKYTFKKYKNIPVPRMMLHAKSIGFTGPDGKRYFFESKPPKEFEEYAEHKNTP